MSKVALVVGGGKSLGAFLCKGLAEAGYRVAVADMDADSAKLTASEIAEVHGAENVMAVQANATQEADVQRMVGAVDDRFGRIDLPARRPRPRSISSRWMLGTAPSR